MPPALANMVRQPTSFIAQFGLGFSDTCAVAQMPSRRTVLPQNATLRGAQHVGAEDVASECDLLPPGHPLRDAAAAAATRPPVEVDEAEVEEMKAAHRSCRACAAPTGCQAPVC